MGKEEIELIDFSDDGWILEDVQELFGENAVEIKIELGNGEEECLDFGLFA